MKKILLTGFEPFADYTCNPSQMLMEDMAGIKWKNLAIFPLLLPVDYKKTRRLVSRKIEKYKPDIILSMGQADGRSRISVERVALNVLDFKIPDNAGHKPKNKPIIKNGPAAYFTSLPYDSILRLLKRKNIPAELSNTAGTYLCNQTMYLGLHKTKKNTDCSVCGFIHVPSLPEQVVAKNSNAPSMSYQIMRKGIKNILSFWGN